ncbi:Spx/MgsR family RNA polymerase-binding regulatory protein [bacterium]|nr:Spx/MgsR family RNA polymerase-binding regulatory protein [bacterium]
MRFYGYDKCDTCRKASKFLKGKSIAFDSLDITTQAPSSAELQGAAKKYGVRKLFNTSGQVYREMKLGEKLPEMPEAQALKLLASNGRLVKRPFVVLKGDYLVGFQQKEWELSLRDQD